MRIVRAAVWFAVLALGLVAGLPAAEAQSPPARVGVLGSDEQPRFSELVSSLSQGLQEHGYRAIEVLEGRVRRGDTEGARVAVRGLIEAVTYRLTGHSTADDPAKYRSAADVSLWEGREPLPRFRRYLTAKGVIDDALHGRIEAEVDAEVRVAIERAEARMLAARPLDMFDHVYGEVPAEVLAQREEFVRELEEPRP